MSEAPCYQCGKPMPVKSTPEMCPSCHHLNFPNTLGMKPTYEELEAAVREYGDSTSALTGQRWWWDTGNPTHYRRRLAEKAIEELAERLAPRKTEEAN